MDGKRGQSAEAPPLEIIFYQPGQSQSSKNIDTRARWEKYADRIAAGLTPTTSVVIPVVLRSLPSSYRPDEDLIDLIKRLGEDAAQDTNKDTSRYKGLLLATICAVLDKLGVKSPEVVDQALGSVADSSSPQYLNTLRRGATMANEIAVEWAALHGDASDPWLIGMASSAVYRACLSIAHWGILSGFKKEAKARILSQPLPDLPPQPALPLLIPSVIEVFTRGRIPFLDVCTCLGYSPQFAAKSAVISQAYQTHFQHASASQDRRKLNWTYQRIEPLFSSPWVFLGEHTTLTRPLRHPSQAEDDALQGC